MTIRRESFIKYVIFSLILGIFTVPNQAIAADTVTKTFTIRGADNALLTGAQVRLHWYDPLTASSVIGNPVSTNASGVAVLTAPLNAPGLNYTVFPAIGDRINALAVDSGIASSSDGSVNVKLERANIFINVQKSDGTNVSGGAVLQYPNSAAETWNRTTMVGTNTYLAAARVIRSGVVGVKLPADLNPASDYAIGVLQYTDGYQPGQFSWRYGLKASGTSGSQSYTMYTDGKFTTELAPVDNSFVLKYSGANIIGTLKNSDGSTFTMTPGMTLAVSLAPSGWSPASFPPSRSNDFTDSEKSPTGNWFARGLGGAGKYQLTFAIGGSLTVSSFTAFIWKNSTGGWSLTENGTYVGSATEAAQIEVRRPATSANFAFQVKSADTQVDLASNTDLQQINNDNSRTSLGSSRLINGKFSGVVPSGRYKVAIYPADSKYTEKTYDLVVTNGVVTSVTDSASNNIAAVNGVYTFNMAGPNLSGTFKDSAGADLAFGQSQWIDLGVQKKNDGNGNWEWTKSGSYQTTTQWSMNLDGTGEFRLVATPNGFSGIAQSYGPSFFVVAGTPNKFSLVSAAAAEAGTTTSLSGMNITMRASNLKMTVRDPRDNSLLKQGWVTVLEKKANGDQSWIGNADIREKNPGLADIRLDDGNYRLELNPQFNGTMIPGLARKYYDVTVSNSGATVSVSYNSVALTADSNGRFGLTASAANVTGKITDPAGTALIGAENKGVNINVQKYVESRQEFDWTSNWSNTDQNGDFSISVSDPGKYRLRIQPNGYANSSIFYSAEFTITTGEEKIDFSTLRSPAPTLTGIVYATNGTTPIRDARVRVFDNVNNQELWQYEAFTGSTGLWSMNLPAGTYSLYAVPPHGTSTYGESDKVSTVTVSSAGVVSLTGDAASGRTATTFNLSLKEPKWSGVVKNPAGSAVVPYATVCLLNNDIWKCAESDVNGAWALSAPAGFTAFSSGALLEIQDNRGRVYPSRRITDLSIIGGAAGSRNAVLSFQASNVEISVTGANNVPVRDVWVTITRQNEGWLGGNNTNASGVSQVFIADLTKSMEIRVEIGGNSPAVGLYSSQFVQLTAAEVVAATTSGIFRKTIQLTAPNLTAVVRDPLGVAVANAWIELFNASSNEFVSNSNASNDGKFSVNAPKPDSGTIEYVLNVNPPGNSPSLYSKNSYSVTVTAGNVVTITPKGSTTAVGTISGAYALSLANPNVSGKVVDITDNGVENSWVVPIDEATGEYMWQNGSNSRRTGTFGMNLPNGTYKIDANLPWNSSGAAKPAQCSITIAGGVITSAASSCVIVDGTNRTLKLAMRAPNVTFTLKQNGNTVSNVNVSLGVGSWYTNAQSSSSGVVSLFVDPVEIKAKSGLSGVQDIRVWVDPPWGTSSMVRWDCNSGDAKPICSDLTDIDLNATTYASVSNNNVTVLGPNASIRVMDPATGLNVGVNAWVSIFAYDTALPQNGTQWVGGGNSDVNGFVGLNIETRTATTRFTVEINPPWNKRVSLTRVVYDNGGAGYTDTELKATGLSFPLGTPNTVITVKAPGLATDNKFGWIGIEEVDRTTNNFITWVGGYGLNDTGTASVALSATKRYRITANASSGRAGAQTVCYIDTSGGTPVISKAGTLCARGLIQTGTNNLTIELISGNVAGYVKHNEIGVPNATVYAKLVGSTNDDQSVFAATSSNGQFGFNLDFSGGKQWEIKVFPFNAPLPAVQLANKTLAVLTADILSNASLEVNLEVKR
jgi:hypothetical protein